MVLPINTRPSIISGVQHAFPLAIIEQELNHSLISFTLSVKTEMLSEEITNDVRFTKCGNYMEIRAEKCAKKTECFSMKECNLEEDVELEILSFRRDVQQRNFGLIIIGDYGQTLQTDQNVFRIGLKGENIFWSENEREYFLYDEVSENKWRKRFRLAKSKNQISYYVMQGNEWVEVYCAELPENMSHKKQYIGIYGNWGEIQYYNWKYMNYLQLILEEKEGQNSLDYFMYPKKGEITHYFQQFLNSNMISYKEFCEVFKGISEGVLWFLQHGYYVELMLSHYNIGEKEAIGGPTSWNYNLLYGYSEDENIFYALKYQENMGFVMINREEMEQYIHCDASIRIYEYAPNNKDMTFQLSRFIHILEQFVEGKNSGEEYENILATDEFVYGMKIFEKLLTNTHAYSILRSDPKISELLYEHSNLMKERLDFLKYRKYISEMEFQRLKSICTEMVEKAKFLKELVIEEQEKEKGNSTIVVCFEELYKNAQLFYGNLLETLCNKEPRKHQ